MKTINSVLAKKNPLKASAWAIILHRPSESILLLKRSSSSRNPNVWNCPGGGIEEGEKPLLAIRREMWEEAGLKHMVRSRSVRVQMGDKTLWAYLYEVSTKPDVTINFESSKYMWAKVSVLDKRVDRLHRSTKYLLSRPIIRGWLGMGEA